MNIIVTTPKSQMGIASREAETCKRSGGGIYFRRFAKKPKDCEVGEKIYYVEDGYLRGFAVVSEWVQGRYDFDAYGNQIGYTRHDNGWNALMNANSWKWIKPIPMKGFQGWKYFETDLPEVGDWLDPKPPTKGEQND